MSLTPLNKYFDFIPWAINSDGVIAVVESSSLDEAAIEGDDAGGAPEVDEDNEGRIEL